MDSYKPKKYLSRQGQKRDYHLKIVETSVQTVNNEATIIEVILPEELCIPNTSETVYALGLHKQIIKAFAVFLSFFIGILLTIPFITQGHPIIVSGPLEIVKLYIIIAIALGLNLSLPFFIYFMWAFIKSRLK